MILSYESKFIFIHIPKTAGTSIENGLRDFFKGEVIYGEVDSLWGYHSTALQLKNKLDNYDEFFKFTIVRNPYDRLYSLGSAITLIDHGKNISEPISKKKFKDWLLFGSRSMRSLPQRKTQLSWIVDNRNRVIVDYIIRFENLKTEFDELVNKLGGGTVSLPHERASNRVKNYQDLYDDEMIEFVQTYHKIDLDYFNYTF